jgi:hypothetical protein
MQISIDVRGQLVRQGAENLNAEIPQIGRRQMRTRMERIKRRMQEYPPERPGQSVTGSHAVLGRTYRPAKRRYRRTGRLGRSWTILNNADKGYALRNDARDPRRGTRYARFVVGDAYGTGQARVHEGRWQVLRDVVDEEVATLPPAVEREIQIVARRNNL